MSKMEFLDPYEAKRLKLKQKWNVYCWTPFIIPNVGRSDGLSVCLFYRSVEKIFLTRRNCTRSLSLWKYTEQANIRWAKGCLPCLDPSFTTTPPPLSLVDINPIQPSQIIRVGFCCKNKRWSTHWINLD